METSTKKTPYKKKTAWELIILLVALVILAMYCCSCNKQQSVQPQNTNSVSGTFLVQFNCQEVYNDSYVSSNGRKTFLDTNGEQYDTITSTAIFYIHCKGQKNINRWISWVQLTPVFGSTGGGITFYCDRDSSFTYKFNMNP